MHADSFVQPRARVGAGVFALLAVLLVLSSQLSAQQSIHGTQGVTEARQVINLGDLARREALAPPAPQERFVAPYMSVPPRRPLPIGPATLAQPLAPVSPKPLVASPALAANFEALADSGTAIPPDTQGAVGPNHLMVTLNSQVRIQDRSGAQLSLVTLNSFWSSTGATNVFDPKVLYDSFNNRWVFAAVSSASSAASSVLIGASQTGDPTGSWNLYRIDADATNVNWADYTSLGFNKDWVVVTVNMFPVAAGSFAGSKIYTFKKTDLYSGAGTASFTLFTDANAFTAAPALTFDNSLATLYLVENIGSSNTTGFLSISTITGAVGSESYTASAATVAQNSPWSSTPPGGNDFAPQQGTTSLIQNNDSRILTVIYRNGSLWACQTAFLPFGTPTRAAIQWWQFSPTGDVLQFGRVDDASGTNFYAFPSIAVNSRNDVLLGFSSFSTSQFASGNYVFRAGTDPFNTLRDPALLKAGEDTYVKTFGGTDNRWGDYSNTVVDPVNDLDFWTIQEYAAAHFQPSGTSKWGTWWGKLVAPAAVKKRRGQLITP